MTWLRFNEYKVSRLCMSSGNSGGSSGGTTIIRYAPYIEDKHTSMLNAYRNYSLAFRSPANSPYKDFTAVEVDKAFFGTGYVITSFPSLYDMYGKFIAGLDIDVLYNQVFASTVNSPEVKNLITQEAISMDEDIEANVLPRFQTGMRDINAVVTSSFVIGKAMIEDSRVKSLQKFSAQIKAQLIPYAIDRWKTHLEWNKNTVMVYAEVMKLYFSAKMDVSSMNYDYALKDILWPFTVMEFERAALGTLQGAYSQTKTGEGGGSKVASALSGALTGAAIGSFFPGPGTAIGAGVGLIAGMFA